MFKYILISLLLVGYFEILGQYLLFRINKEMKAPAMGLGLLLFMSFGYLSTSLITAFHGPFWLVFAIYTAAAFVTFFFVIRDFKKVKWFFDPRQWIIIFIFVDVMIYYAYNTGLGYLNSFDTVYYLNLIATNIKAAQLNLTDLYHGTLGSPVPPAYEMQTYFTFASCLVLIIRRVLAVFGTVHNSEIIIWVFQIIYNFFLASALIVFLEKLTKKRIFLKGVVFFIFLFYFGKLYYNNIFGFYGNTYRMISTAYSVMFVYDLINDASLENKLLFALSVWGACAFSSTSIFIELLLVFASYFVLVDKMDDLFRYYAVVLFLPLVDFIYILIQFSLVVSLIAAAVICILMYVLNGFLVKISRMRFTRYAILSLSFLMMLFLSLRASGSIFNFDAFFKNNSELYDMSINYFRLSKKFGIRNVYVIFIWVSTLPALLLKIKDRLFMAFWILIIVFFNPFCCAFINSINGVYYRAYDIIINPFTIVMFMNVIFDLINNKYVYYGLLLFALVSFVRYTEFNRPMFYHESFKPDALTYDNLSKMKKDDLAVIDKIIEYVEYYDIEDPYIISNNLLTQSNIPEGRYLFGRSYLMNEDITESEAKLFEIFMDKEEENDREIKMENLKDLLYYVEDAGIDFIVVDNTAFTDDEEYYNLIYYMYDLGNVVYTNDSYSLFMYGH